MRLRDDDDVEIEPEGQPIRSRRNISFDFIEWNHHFPLGYDVLVGETCILSMLKAIRSVKGLWMRVL